MPERVAYHRWRESASELTLRADFPTGSGRFGSGKTDITVLAEANLALNGALSIIPALQATRAGDVDPGSKRISYTPSVEADYQSSHGLWVVYLSHAQHKPTLLGASFSRDLPRDWTAGLTLERDLTRNARGATITLTVKRLFRTRG
jgi:hypothetical protein